MKFIIKGEESGEEWKKMEGTAFQCFTKPKTRCSQQPAASSQQPASTTVGRARVGEMWTREQVPCALQIRLEDYGKGNPCSLAVTFVGKQRNTLNTVYIYIYIYIYTCVCVCVCVLACLPYFIFGGKIPEATF